MTNQHQKSLQDYLSKVKKPPTPPLLHFPSNKTLSSSTNWILRGCRHPKTQSFAAGRHENDHNSDAAATLSDIDQFLLENFKSLYQNNNNDEQKYDTENKDKEEKSIGYLFDSPRLIDPPTNLRGSHRFFVAPGSSGSLIEEARTSLTTSFEDSASSSNTTTTSNTSNDSTRISDNQVKRTTSPDDFVAVLKYSPSPYDEFRVSMQEMIEARLQYNGRVGWEFMEELLFCYLNLNDKKSYKYVLSAFVDLIVVLRENSGRIPARSRNGGDLEREKGEV